MKMRVASGGIRTHDTLYSRQMLYQLSYLILIPRHGVIVIVIVIVIDSQVIIINNSNKQSRC